MAAMNRISKVAKWSVQCIIKTAPLIFVTSSDRIHTHAICYASANDVHISLQHRCTPQGLWLCTSVPKWDIVGDEP